MNPSKPETLSQRVHSAALKAALEPFRGRALLPATSIHDEDRFEEWVCRVGDASLSYDRRLDGKALHRLTIREGESIVIGARFCGEQGYVEFRGHGEHAVASLSPSALVDLVQFLDAMRASDDATPMVKRVPTRGDWYPSVCGRRVISVVERPDGRFAIEVGNSRLPARVFRGLLAMAGAEFEENTTCYVGEATVWHDAETGARAGTAVEAALANVVFLYKERPLRAA